MVQRIAVIAVMHYGNNGTMCVIIDALEWRVHTSLLSLKNSVEDGDHQIILKEKGGKKRHPHDALTRTLRDR